MYPEALPQFRLSKWESRSHVPSVDITFPDGHSDKLVLSRHYTSEESRMYVIVLEMVLASATILILFTHNITGSEGFTATFLATWKMK